MAKPDQVAAIKAANGVELNVDHYTAKQLEGLEGLAEKDGKDNLSAFQAQLKEFDDARVALNAQGNGESAQASGDSAQTAKDGAPAQPEPSPDTARVKTVTVRVNDQIAAYGGAFLDPESRQSIGGEPVKVPLTTFVRGLLRSEDILEGD